MEQLNLDINLDSDRLVNKSKLNITQNLVSNLDRVIKNLLVNLNIKSRSLELEVQTELSKIFNLRRLKRQLILLSI